MLPQLSARLSPFQARRLAQLLYWFGNDGSDNGLFFRFLFLVCLLPQPATIFTIKNISELVQGCHYQLPVLQGTRSRTTQPTMNDPRHLAQTTPSKCCVPYFHVPGTPKGNKRFKRSCERPFSNEPPSSQLSQTLQKCHKCPHHSGAQASPARTGRARLIITAWEFQVNSPDVLPVANQTPGIVRSCCQKGHAILVSWCVAYKSHVWGRYLVDSSLNHVEIP
jgi:hypothetical protein